MKKLGILFLAGIIFSIHVNAKESKITHSQITSQILNGYCCVPNLSSGYTARQLSDGQFKTDQETVSLSNIVIGTMDNKEMAVAVLANWTGGSGVFKSLLLYERQGAKMVTVGSYAFGDRAQLRSLSIKNNKVILVSQRMMGGQLQKPETVRLKRNNFDKAECLQEEH